MSCGFPRDEGCAGYLPIKFLYPVGGVLLGACVTLSYLVLGELGHVGAEHPQPEMTNVLMDGGIQVEAKDNAGVTALQLAVEQASDDIICRLVEAGANMKTQDNYGRSVMHRVAAVGDKETSDLILNLGAKKGAIKLLFS